MTDHGLTFDRLARVTFSVNKESRTITGLAVPFGDVGNNGFGRYRFTKGSLDWSKVKYLTHHDWSQAVGTVQLTETDEGLEMTARIARGARGDEVLALTEPDDNGESVYDGLSIGLSANSRFEEDDDGVFNCISGTVLEVSGTPIPAFDKAQVRSVAASAVQNKEKNMDCTKCGKAHAEGVIECAATDAAATFTKADGDKLMEQVQGMAEQIAELQKIKIPVGPGTAQFEVAEEPIYRFAGTEPAPSGFDFATDLLAAARDGDAAAFARVKEFSGQYLAPTFADQPTTTADTAALNPKQYMPDLFLGQAPIPASPLYDFFYKGTRNDVTPFFWSKLDRANTDIGIADHTEGVDPEDRDLVTVVGDTVTPKPVSGKVHITREVGDQGGNPQVSGLIWYEFERSFKVALEARTAALIQAATIAELGAAIPAGSTGTVAGAAVEGGLIGLQFLADGFRFQRAFGHVDLYKALAGATKGDDNADKLYPIINPENATGQAASKWAHLNIGGYGMYPAASLGATDVNQKSIVADPTAVHVWNSGLTRLDKLQESVEGWDLGCFAYWAGIVYDATGLRKITYDKSA